MTIFGPDISSYEHGLDVAALRDPFVILKCTEGTYYTDGDYAGWMARAKAAGKIVIPYHFVKAESSAQAQAAMLAAHIGDTSLPVMLDVETEGASKPNLAQVLAVADAMKARGLNVRLAYLPRWYWEQIGSPSLTPLTDRGIGVVSSAYPRSGPLTPESGYEADGGDNGPGWAAYGGVTPVLWQFTDAGVEQQRVDFNAYRGTVDQLAAMLGGGTAGGSVMEAVDVWAWKNAHLDPIDMRQRLVNAETAAEAGRDGVAALSAKVDQLLAAKPTVDTAAIASAVVSAIEEHLAGGVDVHAVAAAVQAQLALALGRPA